MSSEHSDATFEATWGGVVSNDVIDRKHERTDMYEDPDLLYNHFRTALKDTGPDNRNTFAYDEKRAGGVGKRSSVLSIRENGKRGMAEPKHTEIFTELTGKDPRGNANLPAMSKMVEQSRHRAKNFELSFKDDSDNSILESGRNPGKVSSDIKDAMQKSKQKLQIFNDSDVGWTNGNPQIRTERSLKEKVLEDTQQIDISDADAQHRRSNVTELSNQSQIGWLTQNDQKLKISRYNKVYSGNGKAVNTRYAQNQQEQDMKIRKFRDNYVPTSVIKLMAANTKSRKEYQETLPPSNRFWGKSKESYVRTNTSTFGNGSENSRMSENVIDSFSGKNVTKQITHQIRKLNTERFKGHVVDSYEHSNKMTKLMRNAMEMSNKSSMETKVDLIKVRHEIESTHKTGKLIGSAGNTNNKINTETFKGHVKGTTLTNNKFGKDMVVHNYRQNIRNNQESRVGKDVMDHEENELHDDESHIRNIGSFQKDLIMGKDDSVVDENIFNDSGVKTRHGGLIGTKYMARSHQIDHEQNDVNDK
jgi:hypothetical protein